MRYIVFVIAVIVSTASYALDVEDFLKEPDLREAKISPNGKYLATIWNTDITRIVVVQDLSLKGSPRVATFGDDVIRPTSLSWANDERLLVRVLTPVAIKRFRKNKKKEDLDPGRYRMFSRLIAYDVDGKNNVQLLDDMVKLDSHYNLASINNHLADDDKHILMTAYKRVGDGYRKAAFKVNVYTGESEHVVTGSTKTYRFVSDPAGKILYRYDLHLRAKKIKIYALDNDKWERIDEIVFDPDKKDGIEPDDLIAFSVDSLFYIKKNETTGYKEILKVSRNNNETTTFISLDDQDVIGILVDSKGAEIKGYQYEKDDVFRDHYFDEAEQEAYNKLIKHFPYHYAEVYSVDYSKNKSIVYSSGQDLPGAFFLYDLEKDKLNSIGKMYSSLSIDSLGQPAVATYKTRDGAKIRSYIVFPPNYRSDKAWPMVIVPHGGPVARNYAFYDDFTQFLATRGYVVFKPNFRGSSGYGKAFEQAGYKEWGGRMQDDLEDGVNFMIKKGFADPERICIVGGSYGGYAALMGVIKTPELYQCAVSINGVTDLPSMIAYDEKEFKDYPDLIELVRKRVGEVETELEKLQDTSPLFNVDKISDPILLIAGTKDSIVPFSQSKDLAKALKKHAKDFELLKIKDAGHNIFYYKDDYRESFKGIEEFLAKHL